MLILCLLAPVEVSLASATDGAAGAEIEETTISEIAIGADETKTEESIIEEETSGQTDEATDESESANNEDDEELIEEGSAKEQENTSEDTASSTDDDNTSELNEEAEEEKTSSTLESKSGSSTEKSTLNETDALATATSSDTASSTQLSTADTEKTSATTSATSTNTGGTGDPLPSQGETHTSATGSTATSTATNTQSDIITPETLQSATTSSSTTGASSADLSGGGGSTVTELNSSTSAESSIADSLLSDQTSTSSTATAGSESGTTSTSTLKATSSATNASTTDNSTSTIPTASSTSIVTGDAIVTANLINLVNSNFVNSEGAIVFLDFYDPSVGLIDFRNAQSTEPSTLCSFLSCNGDETTVRITNDATIENTVYLIAQTGGNSVENSQYALINTGDAYANANIVNVANTNIIDSEYLLVILNSFAGLNGDIVFPSLTSYFEGSTDRSGEQTLANSATVENNVILNADTGQNMASTSDGHSLTTGTAATGASIFNQINSNLSGNESVSILFRIGGSWAGEVYGLPKNAQWIQTANGYVLHIDPENTGSSNGVSDTNVYATNTSFIRNQVEVAALTGENQVTGAKTALVSTGNAYAGANIVNIANSNIVGRNWLMAVVNIFGDFKGDISFGRPDVWVGALAQTPDGLKAGDEVKLVYTIQNKGDSPASNLHITDSYSEYLVPEISDPNVVVDTQNRTLTWQVEKLLPGEVIELHYTARVDGAGGGTAITNTIAASLIEKDNDLTNNTEILRFHTAHYSNRGGASNRRQVVDTEKVSEIVPPTHATGSLTLLEVERKPQQTLVTHDRNVSVQTLTIFNPTNRVIPDVTLHDVLSNNGSAQLSNEQWFLGDILPQEELTISYTLAFNPKTPVGRYAFASELRNGEELRRLEQNGVLTYIQPFLIEPDPEPTLTTSAASSSYRFAYEAPQQSQVGGLSTSTATEKDGLIPRAQASDGVAYYTLSSPLLTFIQFFLLPLIAFYLLYRLARRRQHWR